ncbi:hypothetical protein NIES2135_53640 [Leptolyngbya boryana NIES-2135]|jgi:hypothetical protein|uniref:Uncharacterized protein n=1 Tax=Leptolyngbya boryana NIES-2135 TaxID=1973484 RepID=A0A1Z4JP05_LEPBY|nr:MULTISPECIES: hypothetical protein [Leptolyngbya]BAY58491.1 hypothetical protein NIES2135_53640 [Leptolyngbya boryana NIES-2135]MBD2370966.1 hypothetical protein [Leptolyngbya sp. FACHB-161]MBD2377480.1 hypothetical protein [Leptolyngbya sp. FACHB-238]MBD2401888.1 hypothetical protein [Leptolyngbya sp. FACHB-239]MBD2408406.1 hypothetical protein [Leptolyngbya sp. FACHB-402]
MSNPNNAVYVWNNPIYRWGSGFVYRGYFICPVDSGFDCLLGVAVFDPFGQELADETTHQLVSSIEEVWQVGKTFVDSELRRLTEESPNLAKTILLASEREVCYV